MGKFLAFMIALGIAALVSPSEIDPKFDGTPSPIPNVPPAPATLDKYAQAILKYNNAIFVASDVYSVPVKGVVMHKINAATASLVSLCVQSAAKEYPCPVPGVTEEQWICFLLGCLAIEAAFDIVCVNGNLGPGESNTAGDPLGFDMGAFQLKLRYLIGLAQGVVDADTARRFAFDPTRAIRYGVSLMHGKILDAINVIATDKTAKYDLQMQNPLLFGTVEYNFGMTGGREDYDEGVFPAHGQKVLDLTRAFEKSLGVPDFFANLP